MFNCLDSNEALKHKFKKLHTTVVNNVNPASIINFLFQEDVLGADDMRALLRFRDDPQQQCSDLCYSTRPKIRGLSFNCTLASRKKRIFGG